jgi:CarboxypepD_reg-like domain/TonB-dependent Receptor Plug Domain
MKKQLFLLCFAASLLFVCPFQLFGQTQNLKGIILDKSVKAELFGAIIRIQPTDKPDEKPRGTTSDAQGLFRFENLPLGKYTILVSYLGYKNAVLTNISLNSGKETDLIIELEEQILVGSEVVITATTEKNKPLNELSTVSARTFSVEETRRFAAAVNDPARMASSFAGVVSTGDGNNNIAIRGNAPNGLLWRMEGVEIPNPNHFSSVGTSGGGISIISAQLLSNSDFSTGAFAAEYGNALSGVFDLRLRKGNADRREFTIQAGVLGLDLATEGPLKMGQNKGSYLVNYRYSTLSLLAKMGVQVGTATTNFQDLSFNIWMPAGKLGSFSMFGMGGLSNQFTAGKADSLDWKTDVSLRFPFNSVANTGVVGLTHNKTWGSDTWLKTVVAASKTDNSFEFDQFLLPNYTKQRLYETNAGQQKWTVSSVLSHKFSARHYIRSGIYANFLGYDFKQSERKTIESPLVENLRQRGQTQSIQSFLQWQYRPTERVTFNLGAHSVGLLLRKKASFEPRAGLKFAINERQSVSFGYGLHTQMQPLGVYFIKNEAGVLVNSKLDLTKSRHFVLAYDHLLTKKLRIKTEIYHQKIFDAPVSKGESTSFSLLNVSENFPNYSLENSGSGRNTGLELTFEQFLTRGFYFLGSSSWSKSTYRGSDLVWRNTRFDTRNANTLTAGKEWDWARRGKDRKIGLNLKAISVGGMRQTPVDLAASQMAGTLVFQEDKAFSDKLPAYFRIDVGVRLIRNYKHLTTTLSLDMQNATNRKNVGGQYYDTENFAVKTYYQTSFIPILAYKLEF